MKTEIPEYIKNRLNDGEQVIWSGKPEKYELTEGNAKKLLTKSLTVNGIIAAALIILYVVVCLAVGSAVSAGVIGIIVVVTGAIAAGPALDRNKLLKEAKYYVTDSRVIVAMSENNLWSLSRTGVKVRKAEGFDGNETILFGAAVDVPEKKIIKYSINPMTESEGQVTGLIFFNLPKDCEVNRLFHI